MCNLKLDNRTLVAAEGGPPNMEYALFEAGEILLGKNKIGRVQEQGYATTVGEARARLAILGATSELATSAADLMRPTLCEAYARGAWLRKVAAQLDAAQLFEAARYDARQGRYEGTFLDLASLSNDLGKASLALVMQGLYLAAALANEPDDAPLELTTFEFTLGLKPGERTHHRVALEGIADLPALLEDLANRGGGRGARCEPLARATLDELLAERLPAERLTILQRALDKREIPAKGPLSKPSIWEIELLLDTGSFTAALEKLEQEERSSGRTPATTYLRGRHGLLSHSETATSIAPRVSALALSMSSFVELGILAGEAWLAAGDARRAAPYAKDALEARGLDDQLRERASRVLAAAGPGSVPRTLASAPAVDGKSADRPPRPLAAPASVPPPSVAPRGDRAQKLSSAPPASAPPPAPLVPTPLVTAPLPTVPVPTVHVPTTPFPAALAHEGTSSTPPTDLRREPIDSQHSAFEPDSSTVSGEFMRGATRPLSLESAAPPSFAKAPLFPRFAPETSEAAEHLSLPQGIVVPESAPESLLEVLPRSVLEARIQFTLLSRELGRIYRSTRGVELRADLSGIEHMQAYLFERFPEHRVEGPDGAREVQLHGAFLSEILSRALDGEWVDITADQLGHWEMMVSPSTRVWPFGRVSRLIVKGQRERDLIAYFLQLQGRAKLAR